MSIISKISKTASDVAKFMGHYADEAQAIAAVFKSILPVIPVSDAKKKDIIKVVDKLDNAAEKIEEFLMRNPNVGEPVTVKASDVQNAIEKYLTENPQIIADAIAKKMGE